MPCLPKLRNTPQGGLETNSAQRLFGRRTKTVDSEIRRLLCRSREKKVEVRCATIAERVDNNRNLTWLAAGDVVRMQHIGRNNKHWKEAIVTKQVKRSYEVTTKP